MREFENKLVTFHEEQVGKYLSRLFYAQTALIQAYEDQWSVVNYQIMTGKLREAPVYKGNAYGLKVDLDMYVFQMDMPLPFMPNPYVRRFKECAKDYFTAKWLVSEQLRDVVEQLVETPIFGPAALFIKHFYQNERILEVDNKVKQVIINSLKRGNIIKDDNVRCLPYFSEEAIESRVMDKTMIFIGPFGRKRYMEQEVMAKYEQIDQMQGVIEGRFPRTILPDSPLSVSILQKPKRKKSARKEKLTEPKPVNDYNNFM